MCANNIEINKLYHDDCFNIFPKIPNQFVDMILCDMPYNMTACTWDSEFDLNMMWEQYKRIIKPRGAIVLTTIQPFTSIVIMSNPKMKSTELIWVKHVVSNIFLAKKMPLRKHENILVFGVKSPNYYPQMIRLDKPRKGRIRSKLNEQKEIAYNMTNERIRKYRKNEKVYTHTYPNTVIIDKWEAHSKGTLHPTQKPVSLFEYLIKLYTQPGELVLDNCIGSGTTAIAAIRTGRSWIGIEKDENYYQIAANRIKKEGNRLLTVLNP